jgi:hypothetical protein
MVSIKSPQDLGAAITFFVIGVGGLWFGQEYDVGTMSAMGPGYMPMLLSYSLIVFGIGTGFSSLRYEGPAIATVRWRPVILILLSILLFALIIRTAGLLVTVSAVTVIAAVASTESKWLETIALAVFLSVFCVLVFIYGLGQAIPIIGGD